jgi:hypothetical protein
VDKGVRRSMFKNMALAMLLTLSWKQAYMTYHMILSAKIAEQNGFMKVPWNFRIQEVCFCDSCCASSRNRNLGFTATH